MKTIGVIGGLSWHSTAQYYQHLNQLTADRLGGLHSAKVNLISLDFALVAELMQKQDWTQLSALLKAPTKSLAMSGADCIILANNTLHQLVPAIESTVTIPFLHIADSLGEQLNALNISTVGLLGTNSTMESGFYATRLAEKYHIEVVTPQPQQRVILDRYIFSELCQGHISDAATEFCHQMVNELAQQGAQAIALACTELPLVFDRLDDCSLPLLDTSQLHCQYAIDWALADHQGE